MAKDVSPEEKLLGLIKKKGKKFAVAQPPSTEAQNRPAASAMSKADERVSEILKASVLKNKFFEPAVLKTINRYLVAILGALSLYFLADMIFIRPYKDVQSLVARSSAVQGEKALSHEPGKVVPVKDYSAYSNAIPAGMVFGQSAGAQSEAEDTAATGSIADQVGLVGIIAGDNPQAIIEDKKAQKTYYLSKGQSFDGYTVEDILEDRVILTYEGRRMSLFL